MIDPDRVIRMAYLPGENLEPGISLVGTVPRRVIEGDEAYMSVELEGVIPGSIVPSTYDCKFVHFQIPHRGWVLVFENLHLSISVVGGLPGHREREGARLFGVRFLE
jgi:hypothetical protein